MPRPGPNNSSPRFYAYPHSLSERTKVELLSVLNLDSELAGKVFAEAEKILGTYPGAVEALDNEPSGAYYRDQLKPIGRDAFDLSVRLLGLNDYLADTLTANGADPNVIAVALLNLHSAATTLVKQCESADSRGKPQRLALRWVISELRNIFNRYYQDCDEEQNNHGAINPLSMREADEEEFIKFALADANISAPNNIRQYFNEPESPAS